ncbi:MAG TPA: hypothetical protein VNV42_06540 [Solirubrobacteraceae bacterium]|jgi:antitoxin (DNA-binding transcriptional repressor) of toxin-antitoxin stability system|nr:hypothetical protein [Solirubrobacteraceae bacterium]
MKDVGNSNGVSFEQYRIRGAHSALTCLCDAEARRQPPRSDDLKIAREWSFGHVSAVGAEVLVTRRGQPIARLSAVKENDPLQDLVRRGLVTPPSRRRTARRAQVKARGPVAELVAEQRR